VSDNDKQKVLDTVKNRFGIEVNGASITFIQLKKCDKLRPEQYPSATLIWQIKAYYEVSMEALCNTPCDLFIDTMGVGAAYPLVRAVFGTRVLSYTHYPTISSDMVN
jgi:alpha-1,2-mannosyltransferase